MIYLIYKARTRTCDTDMTGYVYAGIKSRTWRHGAKITYARMRIKIYDTRIKFMMINVCSIKRK